MADGRLPETGISLGTPAYMSPEQAAGAAEADGRSDLYSLGCVVYEMLARAPPFTGATAAVILARQVVDPVPSLATARPGIPAEVTEAVLRALAKSPADRFPTVAAFAAALDRPPGDVPRPSPAIVVLPFANLSPDPDNEYFAEGLTEDVAAATCDMQFTGFLAFGYGLCG